MNYIYAHIFSKIYIIDLEICLANPSFLKGLLQNRMKNTVSERDCPLGPETRRWVDLSVQQFLFYTFGDFLEKTTCCLLFKIIYEDAMLPKETQRSLFDTSKNTIFTKCFILLLRTRCRLQNRV